MGKRAQISDLFRQGVEVWLDDPESGTQLMVWVQKANRYEREDITKKAHIAQSRRRMAFSVAHSDEADHLQGIFEESGDELVIDALLGFDTMERMTKAVRKVRSDPDWDERISVIDDGLDEATDDSEREVWEKLNAEFVAEVSRRVDAERAEELAVLKAHDRARLEELYRKRWIDTQARIAFNEWFQVGQIMAATRVCEATLEDLDHSACVHKQHHFTHADEVREMPDTVLARIVETIQLLDISVDAAKNSVSLAGSSVPSAPQNAPAASPA